MGKREKEGNIVISIGHRKAKFRKKIISYCETSIPVMKVLALKSF